MILKDDTGYDCRQLVRWQGASNRYSLHLLRPRDQRYKRDSAIILSAGLFSPAWWPKAAHPENRRGEGGVPPGRGDGSILEMSRRGLLLSYKPDSTSAYRPLPSPKHICCPVTLISPANPLPPSPEGGIRISGGSGQSRGAPAAAPGEGKPIEVRRKRKYGCDCKGVVSFFTVWARQGASTIDSLHVIRSGTTP